MNKKKILSYSVSALALAMLLSAGSASAFGGGMGGIQKNLTPDQMAIRHSNMFSQQAQIIGATEQEVKDAWSKGISFVELAKSKGVTEQDLKSKMKQIKELKRKEQIQALVSKGVITQAQADARLSTMQKKMDEVKEGKGKGNMGKIKKFMNQ
jgi:predicted amidohydrolase YtcJ